MKKTVKATVARISSGVLILTEGQASLRKHNLESLGKNKYQIINPVEFKKGEEIGFDGAVPKALDELFFQEEKLSKADKAAADKAAADKAAADKAAADKAAGK